MYEGTTAFDFTNGATLLRVLCGLYFLPHVYCKVAGNPPPVLGFFIKAGFRPARLFMRLAAVVESIAAFCMVFNIYTAWAALFAAAALLVAVGALYRAEGTFKWLWGMTGIEYPVFWAAVCLILARIYWT